MDLMFLCWEMRRSKICTDKKDAGRVGFTMLLFVLCFECEQNFTKHWTFGQKKNLYCSSFFDGKDLFFLTTVGGCVPFLGGNRWSGGRFVFLLLEKGRNECFNLMFFQRFLFVVVWSPVSQIQVLKQDTGNMTRLTILTNPPRPFFSRSDLTRLTFNLSIPPKPADFNKINL